MSDCYSSSNKVLRRIFWFSVIAILGSVTWIWYDWVQKPLTKSETTIKTHITTLNQQMSNTKAIAPENELLKENLMDLHAVSLALQTASVSGGVRVLNMAQGAVTATTSLQNIQVAKLEGKHIASVAYTTQLTGNYMQYLAFLKRLDKEKGIFIQSIDYAEKSYLISTLTLNFQVYNAV